MFQSLYAALEKNFFSSLTKKIVGNILFFFILTGLMFVLCWWSVRLGKEALLTLKTNEAVVAKNISTLNVVLDISIFLFIGAIAGAATTICILRHSIVRPIQTIAHTFCEEDISNNIPLITNDEIKDLSENYNSFIGKIRDILGNTRRMGLDIAIESTKVAKRVKDSTVKSQRQGELSDIIFSTSNDVSQAINEVSKNTQNIYKSTTENLSTAKDSLQELRKVKDAIYTTGENVSEFTQTVNNLTTNSERIKDVVLLIKDISDQTNLLALNAAIEAARAGQAGRGFSVVADEVRKLAERTNKATEEISDNINEMLQHVKSTSSGIAVINESMGQVEEVIGKTSHRFENLVQDFENNSGQLSRIASAIEELSVTNLEIHRQVTDIHGLSKGVAELLNESTRSSSDMNKITESMLEAVTRFRIGNNILEEVIEKVRIHRDKMQTKIQEISSRGVNVFDRKYKAIPNTDPQKFSTVYSSVFAQEVQPLCDEARRDLKVIYSVPLDVNGYLSIHHKEVSKPMTGDPKTDLIYSRQQRMFFTVETEKRRSSNTNPFLFQTYMRDTGAILNDLSMPIYIDGKHWGAIVVGFSPDRLKSTPDGAPILP